MSGSTPSIGGTSLSDLASLQDQLTNQGQQINQQNFEFVMKENILKAEETAIQGAQRNS